MIKKIYTKYGWVSLNVRNVDMRRILAVQPRQRNANNDAEKQFRKKFPDGAVLISRRDERSNRLLYQVYRDGIYSAIRSRSRIRARYGNSHNGGEIKDMILNVNSARLYLEKLLRYTRLSDKDKKELSACLEQLSDVLETKRNIFKEIAHDYIELSADPEDSLGRVNPSVKCSQLSTGMRNLNFRLLEIPSIVKYVNRDQIRLMQERDRLMFTCKELGYRFLDVLGRPAMQNPRRYKSRDFPKLSGWIKKMMHSVDSLDLAPFTKTRYHALRDLGHALEAAEARDYVTIKNDFVKVKNSLGFKEAQFHLEEIIMTITLLLDELDANPSDRNKDWSVNRAFDLGGQIQPLRKRLNKILDDRNFRYRPKKRLIALLRDAEADLYSLRLDQAKQLLKSASNLL